jgi:lipoprotein-anchoring transpeptidase ErfK/SrfK
MKNKLNQFLPFTLFALLLWPVQAFALPNVNPQTVAAQAPAAMVPVVTVDCNVEKIDKPVYSGEFVSIDTNKNPGSEELFLTIVKIKNTGNVPWFSDSSGCHEKANTFLGTTKKQDRISKFFTPGSVENANWFSGNRIKMKTLRVNPGEIAEFKFVASAPLKEGIYREFFAPVTEGVAWVTGKAEFKVDFTVGNPQYDSAKLKYSEYIEESVNLLELDLSGEKKILIDLSEQKMYLKIGDNTIRTFRVSTGTAKTPTPVGTMKILSKQEVRVASSKPHYIMPKFMLFKKGGYGIHALPSLANDKGVYWREALNHIGSRRSHGCIRLLPKDADFTYEFGEVGTTVQVIY